MAVTVTITVDVNSKVTEVVAVAVAKTVLVKGGIVVLNAVSGLKIAEATPVRVGLQQATVILNQINIISFSTKDCA